MPNLAQLVYELTCELQTKQFTIATAESCTGGLVAAALTELPGSSLWFDRGFVTYSNLAKEEMLTVTKELLELNGAVSEPIVRAMALGALQHSTADVSLAVTGIAGPSGGSGAKPVGTVWFAWAKRNAAIQSECCHFPQVSREEIRRLSCIHALKGMQLLLLNEDPV
jgi:nicotinamide-nucleotide amidase